MKHKMLVRYIVCWHYCCVIVLPSTILFMKYTSKLLYYNQWVMYFSGMCSMFYCCILRTKSECVHLNLLAFLYTLVIELVVQWMCQLTIMVMRAQLYKWHRFVFGRRILLIWIGYDFAACRIRNETIFSVVFLFDVPDIMTVAVLTIFSPWTHPRFFILYVPCILLQIIVKPTNAQ
jgi:hypothetical protein